MNHVDFSKNVFLAEYCSVKHVATHLREEIVKEGGSVRLKKASGSPILFGTHVCDSACAQLLFSSSTALRLCIEVGKLMCIG